MDVSYRVGTRNRYELFYDNDNDAMDMMKKPKKKAKNAEKENKAVSPKNKEASTKPTIDAKPVTKPEINDKPQPRSNGVARKFGDREERNNRQNTQEADTKSGDINKMDKERPANSGFRRGANKPQGGRGGKRVFDRRSGMTKSGVKPQEKRQGSGPRNWGSDKETEFFSQESKAQDKVSSEEEETVPATEDTPEVKENEEPKEMTLDEWKAMQKREKPTFNVRQAGEGENREQWKDGFVLNKKPVAPATETEETQEEKHSKKKTHVTIDFRFSDSRNRRGGPGGRGRGGKYQSYGKQNSRAEWQQKAPQMDNEQDFPSLG